MLKGHLYFSQKGDLTCRLAFALFELCEKDLTAYSQFCMIEVFENYSVKMYDYSKKQFNELKSGPKELAKKIIAYFETRLEKQQLVQSVMDMRPSVEHQRLILKAKLVKNQQIMEKEDAMYFTAALFPKQKMKYGKRFSYVIDEDFEYSVDGDTVTITEYKGNGGDVVIPSEIDGKKVTAIGEFAFEGTDLTSITIPISVK